MSVKLELSNLGPLRAAELEVGDLTLLIGDNNTGKTFFATVLHRVLGTTPRPSLWRSSLDGGVPPEVEDWITKTLDTADDDGSVSEVAHFTPSKATLKWAKKLTTEVLQDYGTSVRESIAYAFGAEPSRLRRRTRSRHASDCYLRISNSEPDWQVKIRFDSDEVSVVPPDPEQWLRLVFMLDNIPRPFVLAKHSSAPRDDHLLLSYIDMLSWGIRIGLFERWPAKAIHLPADRTGIMQSHNVLAGAAVIQSARAGVRPIEIETLPGTSADFLSLILTIPDPMLSRISGPSPFAGLVKSFEKNIGAEIVVDQRSDGLDGIMAVTSEGRFPMARASSMLSELAPLLLVLKSPNLPLDHLTIDEPEAHLHPTMQVRVASFLAALVNKGMRVVLTTHSDFFVSQFNNMMRLNELAERSAAAKSFSFPVLDRSRVRALRFSRENGWCVARESVPDSIDGVDESTFTEVMRSQYDDTAKLVNQLLENAHTS